MPHIFQKLNIPEPSKPIMNITLLIVGVFFSNHVFGHWGHFHIFLSCPFFPTLPYFQLIKYHNSFCRYLQYIQPVLGCVSSAKDICSFFRECSQANFLLDLFVSTYCTYMYIYHPTGQPASRMMTKLGGFPEN